MIRTLMPIKQPQLPAPSTMSPLMLALLAALGYGGYRVYKHFKKG